MQTDNISQVFTAKRHTNPHYQCQLEHKASGLLTAYTHCANSFWRHPTDSAAIHWQRLGISHRKLTLRKIQHCTTLPRNRPAATCNSIATRQSHVFNIGFIPLRAKTKTYQKENHEETIFVCLPICWPAGNRMRPKSATGRKEAQARCGHHSRPNALGLPLPLLRPLRRPWIQTLAERRVYM